MLIGLTWSKTSKLKTFFAKAIRKKHTDKDIDTEKIDYLLYSKWHVKITCLE